MPNRAGRELNFVGTNQIETENQFMTKVDYNLSRHQLSGRYFFTDYDRPAVVPANNILAASSAGNAVRVQNVSVNHTYTFGPTLLLTSTFGLNRQRGLSVGATTTVGRSNSSGSRGARSRTTGACAGRVTVLPSIFAARDMVNEPPSVMTAAELARRAVAMCRG